MKFEAKRLENHFCTQLPRLKNILTTFPTSIKTLPQVLRVWAEMAMVAESVLSINVVTVLTQPSAQYTQRVRWGWKVSGNALELTPHWLSVHTVSFEQSESVCLITVHPSGWPEGNGANLASLPQAVTCSLPLILLTGVSLLLRNY